ncbi:MAG: small-conductance mechanosensitive channel [Cyclobacteriaceae bacterium]|jgi:small-conductance mechanosensitive channel
MEELKDLPFIRFLLDELQGLNDKLFSAQTGIELVLVVSLGLAAWLLARYLRPGLTHQASIHQQNLGLYRLYSVSAVVLWPLYWLALQWLCNWLAHSLDYEPGLMHVTASLLSAWVIIRIATTFIRSDLLGKAVATAAWLVAALNIIGWLDQAILLLNYVGMDFGSVRVSLFTVLKGMFALGVLLWVSNVLATLFENRIRSIPDLTPSVQELFAKLFKLTAVFIAVMVAISAVGIDLTAFAVVGGAVGVGIGLGLQKIVANLISGIILLLDKSIKPGDIIAVGDYYGRVDSLGARYVSVTTRDGIEHLIPNEELIVTRVENWSHSNTLYRVRLPVGVHYKSDVKLAMRLCREAAAETTRVLTNPAPNCLMRGFGDNSVDLEIRFWIDDPMNGRANVKSDMLVLIWDKFAAHDIEIPYPQRDIHLRSPSWEQLKGALPAAED